MPVEIYLDVLFLENVVINYLILWITMKFSRSRVSSYRLLAGALIGALYVVALVLFPERQFYYTTVSKIALSFLIVAVTFTPARAAAFMKTLVIFYIATFIFAGAAFAFLYMDKSGGFVEDGIIYVYWQSKLNLVVFSALAAIIILKVFWDVIQVKLSKERLLVQLKIIFDNLTADLAALVDTGNSLRDPITNMPVVVVEFAAIKSILPSEIKEIFEKSLESDLGQVTSIVSRSSWYSRFRLIPFSSLGKENGVLIGFKPDYIEIEDNSEKRGIYNVIIGIYNRNLSRDESYAALLSPDVVAERSGVT